ncbi:predicted GPI-anchored protein 58 [Thrips palmi]|uniref:Predicted GPI-anchored protein 58 n=1 Tax=Thrips palmi TaxID=161013 RepID=A0A6P8ZTL3_THRPL|nr:predicted GPI-anchored protein 58 [Thrips palmi]
MLRLCLVAVLAVSTASAASTASTASAAAGFIPPSTVFAPAPPTSLDILPPPPLPESPPPEPHPPPPDEAAFVPATPEDAFFNPEVAATAPAPNFAVQLAPAPRRYTPFAQYGPPAPPARPAGVDPNFEFNAVSSDWNSPLALARARAGLRRRPHRQRHGAGQDDPNFEFSEISSDWNAPSALAGAHASRRGRPAAQRHGAGQEDPNFEFNEISSDWGAPIGALAAAYRRHRLQQGLQDDEEPLLEFNEISSDWSIPASALLTGSEGGLRRQHGHHRHGHRHQHPAAGQSQQQQQPQVQPQVQTQVQPQLQRTTQPQSQPSQQAGVDGRFVYSHLVDGLLFTGPHSDSPLHLARSDAVKLIGGSFSFVSPDGVPVNIRKIQFHNPEHAVRVLPGLARS